MARKTIKSNYYLFDASAREVIIPGGVQREQLILITNVTDNKVIYNFSDPELGATEYHISTDIRNVVTTRLVLSYDTTSMSDTDQLQIIVDEYEETYRPSETYHDAVNKMRVASPQSQVDTDFEYGIQSTKWEGLSMINNNPFAYKTDDPIDLLASNITAVNKSRTITIACDVTATGIQAGQAIVVVDTNFPGANGVFITDTADSGSNLVTYTAKYEYSSGSGSIYDADKTAVYKGIHYSGSTVGGNMNQSNPQSFEAIASGVMAGSVKVTCQNAHGLEVGNEIAVFSPDSTNCSGSWTIARVEDNKTFYYFPEGTPSSANAGSSKKIYPRPQGQSVHRAFDGGVKLSTNSFSKNQQAVRQTKRYFRYQSGKGVAFSTGSILAPAIENIDSITSSGTTVTVICPGLHNVTKGTIVKVDNVDDNVYNGEFTVTDVVDQYTFKYETASTPNVTTAGGQYTITPINAYGAQFELGMMDQQNGIFFRYQNGHLEVVRRTSTFQLAGKAQVVAGSTSVSSFIGDNGASTQFSKQLKIGDYIVLRGSSYRVDAIHDDDELTIFPDYRGPSATNVPITKTVETQWPQSEWNLDRCDGTGKSGYTIDVTKMQMFYMDYSWYGAGFIRWGFRGEDGNVIYAHKVPNNNANTEAYMRSGNLPARYEVNTVCPSTEASYDLGTGDSTLYVKNAPAAFPPTGTLRIRQIGPASGSLSKTEYVNYSGRIVFKQDIIEVNGATDTIKVQDVTGLSAGNQTIVFDRPLSNIVANKVYYIHSVQNADNTFKIKSTTGGNALSLDAQTGSILSPLAIAESGAFTGLTREQAGATGISTNSGFTAGTSVGVVSNGSGIQAGQVVVGTGIAADTYVHSVTGNTVSLSKGVLNANPSGMIFPPMGSGAAQSFDVQGNPQTPVGVELIRATSVPTISHWGSSVIMEGRYDDDRAYVYTYGTRTGKPIKGGETRGLLAIRVAPSVSNGTPDRFGYRELVNRMQLVLSSAEVDATGSCYIELVLNPRVSEDVPWENVGGTSLAQYADISELPGAPAEIATDFTGGEVIFGFYVGRGVNQVDLTSVKEISNSILGGGTDNLKAVDAPNPTGMYPDGPEVLAFRVTNINAKADGGGGGGVNNSKRVDAKISWTEAQA